MKTATPKKTRLLSAEYVRNRLIYEPETGIFRWRVYQKSKRMVGQVAGHLRKTGQVVILLENQSYLAHRIAWVYVTGKNPTGQIDHINCNPSDNRFENLRECTASENCRNKKIPANNTSGVKGVSLFKGRWAAKVGLKGKKFFFGYHESLQSAAIAVKLGRAALHGEFTRHQ